MLRDREVRYRDIVCQSVDALLDNARDTYGSEHSGMILSVLDRRTAKPIEADSVNDMPEAPYGVRASDRTGPGGSNANLQMDLYRVLQHAGRITGEPGYDKAARKALVDFVRITQHPDTGLLAWGEHLYWNCVDDCLGEFFEQHKTHEPKRKFIYFDVCYEGEPEAA